MACGAAQGVWLLLAEGVVRVVCGNGRHTTCVAGVRGGLSQREEREEKHCEEHGGADCDCLCLVTLIMFTRHD